MNKISRNIEQRLSLREPQKEALKILAHLADELPLNKDMDLEKCLSIVKQHYSSVTDFERDFPSLCFALATGVGKTRLMGAFISYLHLAKKINNFLVLAPNLTIYNKLIADFTPNTPKYVFQGIAQFSQNPPVIVTGDNYESGLGVREYDLFGTPDTVHINIFNISKMNSEVRGGKALRMKRLAEVMGESYFDYLANLPDLVILMDESHRYRATAGVKAINELKPILGLELTATPQVEQGTKSISFNNVVYSYPLYQALDDGYIKEPAVATRENFDASLYEPEQLEQLKLEDAVRIHETIKTELTIYATNFNQPLVKPFMLVVAQDTTHANNLMAMIKSESFFSGRYKDKVITVHSTMRGEEKDDNVERLLAVEDPKESTEIVIHVNMLKEGWDVTNLYTIVPLRAANSRTLVEQSIGRGLRLPYGRRVGVPAIDRLTIVAHDKFNEIIAEAQDRKSIIRTGLIIGRDIDEKPRKAILVSSNLDNLLGQSHKLPTDIMEAPLPGFSKPAEPAPLFQHENDKEIVRNTLEIISEFERLPSSRNLIDEQVKEEITRKVTERSTSLQGSLNLGNKAAIQNTVQKVIEAFIDNSIDIPRIFVTPKPGRNYYFKPFKLDTTGLGKYNPVEQDILIQHLGNSYREKLEGGMVYFTERMPEDYLVSALLDYNDISYDDHSASLYDLSGQMVEYLRSYLNDPADVLNVMQYYQKPLAKFMHTQMQNYFQSGSHEYDVTVTSGFTRPKVRGINIGADDKIYFYRHAVDNRSGIRGLAFQGFNKCLYPVQKFDSDSERAFSVLLEDTPEVIKWYRPGREDLRIYYSSEHTYEPDFVVEMADKKLLCEVKMEKELDSEDVQHKAQAARLWRDAATEHELSCNGKPWHYLLIPHTAIQPSATLDGLIQRFGH